MSTPLEGIVRPFTDHNVFPVPFTRPGGSSSNQMVRVAIGFQGSIKSMGVSFSATLTSKMGQTHREKVPTTSQSLQDRLSEAAGT